MLLVFSTAAALFLCYALLMQTGLGVDALTAGSIFAPASVGFVVGSMLAPRLVARYGTPAIALAALFHGGATAALMLVGAAGGALSPWSLVPVLVWLGAAQGAVNTPLVNLTLGLVPDHQAGMAAGVVSTLQQVGAALGVAAAGMLFSGALEAGARRPATAMHRPSPARCNSTWPPLRCRRCCCGDWAGAAEAGPPAARPAGWPSVPGNG